VGSDRLAVNCVVNVGGFVVGLGGGPQHLAL
jgi:hypothetical protein